MKKIIIPLILLLAACLAGAVFLLSGVFADKSVFPKNSTVIINGWSADASGKSPSEILGTYLEENREADFEVSILDETYPLSLNKSIKHSVKESDIQNLLDGCSDMDYVIPKKQDFVLIDGLDYNESEIKDKIKEIIKKAEYHPQKATDAKFDKKTLKVVPEKKGTEIDTDKAVKGIMEAITKGEKKLPSLTQEEYYVQPSVTSADIEEKFADVLKIKKWEASYSVTSYKIKLSDYPESIRVNDDGSYTIDKAFLTDAVLQLSKTVDKIGEKRKFKSTKQGTIWVSGGTYGQMMDNEAETKYLGEMLDKEKKVKDREPVWKIKPPKPESEETYIEVDISAQHAWYYKNGKLIMDTSVVTGCSSKKHDTPKGWYFVSEKVNGKYLTGPGYKTWVNKWMRLTNTGIGLHDATWRGSFGGSIYKTNGSHGCINMPYNFAKKLYDKIDVGIMVVIV